MTLLGMVYHRNRLLFSCLLILIGCLYFRRKDFVAISLPNLDDDHRLMIERIRMIPTHDENHTLVKVIHPWIRRYNLMKFFDFYWYETDGYHWHLQQMIDLKHLSSDRSIYLFQWNYTRDYLNEHPQYGVVIDTAFDPFLSLFPPLPRIAWTWKEVCEQLEFDDPCQMDFQRTSSQLITYGVYNVIIGNPSLNRIHYDEMIYLYDEHISEINSILFVCEILPRLIRLLALVPQTAVVSSPYFNWKIPYIHQYIQLLIERGLIRNGQRLVGMNPKKSYHAHVIYATTSPRADLLLLHSILIPKISSPQQKLILILRDSLGKNISQQFVQIIDLFEFPTRFAHLKVLEYDQRTFNLSQIADHFTQARIVIGFGDEIFSSIIWCLPRTQIVEIGQKKMTNAFYRISLQLKFDYWLLSSTNTNEFRSLFLKILTHLETI